MSTTELVVQAVIISVVIGILIGAVAWDITVGDSLRKQRDRADRRRYDAMQRERRATTRADAYAMLLHAIPLDEELLDNDDHSRKVPLEVVR